MLVANVKSIFSKGVHRRCKLLEFQVENGIEKPLSFPEPVVTRWNSWFNAAKFISNNFDI